MSVLADDASSKLSSFNAQELTNILWAIVKMLLMESKLPSFTDQNLSNMARALATLGHNCGAILARIKHSWALCWWRLSPT